MFIVITWIAVEQERVNALKAKVLDIRCIEDSAFLIKSFWYFEIILAYTTIDNKSSYIREL